MYGFLMEKIADSFLFLLRIISLSGVMSLWKNQNEILSASYLEKIIWARGLKLRQVIWDDE